MDGLYRVLDMEGLVYLDVDLRDEELGRELPRRHSTITSENH